MYPERRSALRVSFLLLVLVVGTTAVSAAPQGATGAAGGAGQGPAVLPVEEIRPGMQGVGYTVVQGAEPEPFRVEILGVMHDLFPKQDLIVARLSGLDLEEAGVFQGMSGSPVYIDDKLVGAVAYQMADFSREAIAGIMPMASMLRVVDLQSADTRRLAASGPVERGRVLEAAGSLLAGESSEALGSLGAPRPVPESAGIRPIAVPLSASGLHPDLLERVSPLFQKLGWRPVMAGTTGGRPVRGELQPGSAIGVQLVRGDINIAATGTVTHVDGDRLLAFGHPYLQGGDVDFPLVRAEVLTVIKRLQSSWHLSTTGDEIVGAIRQDRFQGILGVLGAEPRMIPVHLAVDAGDQNTEEFDFELVSDKMLSPLFLFFGMSNGIQNLASAFGDSTVEVEARFRLEQGLPPVKINNIFSSDNQAFFALSSTITAIYNFLYDNQFAPVEVSGIDLGITVRDDRSVAEITRVLTDRVEVHPGETVNVNVWLKPYRQPDVRERLQIHVPDDMPSGPLSLLVGDATTISQEEQTFLQGEVAPQSLEHLVRLLNGIRRNDRIYVQASRPDEGAYFKGEVMPSLPPSMLSVLSTRQASGDFVRLSKTVIAEEEKAVPYVVSGQHRIRLQVTRR